MDDLTDLEPKPQPNKGFDDTNCSTTQNEMPPDESSGDTNFNTKTQKMPPDDNLLAEETGGAGFERPDDKSHVQTARSDNRGRSAAGAPRAR